MTIRRRDVVTLIGAGAVAVSVPALAEVPVSHAGTPAPAKSEAFRGLEAGLRWGPWEVEAVHGPTHGTVAVHLRDGENHFRLNVLKRDDTGVPGVGQSKSLAVYVCNDGGPTVEREGQAAFALAAWLEHYERTGLPLPKLITLREHARDTTI